jgi:hypothetical protein
VVRRRLLHRATKSAAGAFKRLGDSLDSTPSLYFTAVRTGKAPPDDLGQGL